jgi:hypothetical protein
MSSLHASCHAVYFWKRESPNHSTLRCSVWLFVHGQQEPISDLLRGHYGFAVSFLHTATTSWHERCSIEARVLLSLKTDANEVPPHTFIDYFQMLRQCASACCKHFVIVVLKLFREVLLRCPTKDDLNKITISHKNVTVPAECLDLYTAPTHFGRIVQKDGRRCTNGERERFLIPLRSPVWWWRHARR